MRYEGYRLVRLAKPCPLCGSKHIAALSRERYENGYADSGYNTIRCENCGVEISNCTMVRDDTYNNSVRAVLKLWNRRAA